jgi:hypothetical protein
VTPPLSSILPSTTSIQIQPAQFLPFQTLQRSHDVYCSHCAEGSTPFGYNSCFAHRSIGRVVWCPQNLQWPGSTTRILTSAESSRDDLAHTVLPQFYRRFAKWLQSRFFLKLVSLALQLRVLKPTVFLTRHTFLHVPGAVSCTS